MRDLRNLNSEIVEFLVRGELRVLIRLELVSLIDCTFMVRTVDFEKITLQMIKHDKFMRRQVLIVT